ncbi:MAG: quinone-dependent dihydroorotate dehydrogenase [Myxococcales bacterium]|nr:quinone-dependent dihydroorotate dehydrogenase [Myxococcales bacterium]
MYSLMRALLFQLDAERAHHLAVGSLARMSRSGPGRQALRLAFGARVEAPTEVLGLRFPNKIGLAAGFDKDATAWRGFAAMGFGHVEVGTITPRAQPGNPLPRVFRLPEDQAVINRMGFPGRGMGFAARHLDQPKPDGLIVGVNFGKNKDTPLEEAAQDYLAVMDELAQYADYLTVNVSSPNTPGLRKLQTGDRLEALLRAVVQRRDELRQERGGPMPLLVKLAPDLDDADLDDALEAIDRAGIDGIIATNTTLDRSGLKSADRTQTGGLSGAPLTERATRMVSEIHRRTDGKRPIIAVGGVMTPDDAKAKLDAGASLVQIYTGLIYGGPSLVGKLAKATS